MVNSICCYVMPDQRPFLLRDSGVARVATSPMCPAPLHRVHIRPIQSNGHLKWSKHSKLFANHNRMEISNSGRSESRASRPFSMVSNPAPRVHHCWAHRCPFDKQTDTLNEPWWLPSWSFVLVPLNRQHCEFCQLWTFISLSPDTNDHYR